jgi:putative heme iron utilization protein
MKVSKEAGEIRELLGRERSGVLSTISVKEAGWPFGSITPYAQLETGEPIVLISEIAEHTRNVHRDARVSLLVQESAAQARPQAGARVTILGYAIPVPAPYIEHAQRGYSSLFPDSADYFLAHDFSLYRIVVTQIRYIGGFGDIHWVAGDAVVDYAAASDIDPLAAQIDGVCKHMNEDHSDSLVLMSERLATTPAQSARMIRVDSDGFDVIAVQDGVHRYVRLAFPGPVSTAEETRIAMVKLVKKARSLEQEEN